MILETILEKMNVAVLALNSDNKIIMSNAAAKKYYKFDKDGVAVTSVIKGAEFLQNIEFAQTSKETIVFDSTDGETLEIKITSADSDDVRLIITAQDVTKIRKLQKEKQDFFANASHELNTPLTSILGYTEILKAEKVYKEDFINTIAKQGARMQSLIKDMLMLSELEGKPELPVEPVDLMQIASDVIAANKPKAVKKEIEIIDELQSVVISANKEKITELVSNLVDNAIKYNNIGGEVLVQVYQKEKKAVIKVRDNGIGIPKKSITRIFERFYRVDKSRSKQEGGTGLGLAIVKHICNLYNATYKVISREGKSTEIAIRFPL